MGNEEDNSLNLFLKYYVLFTYSFEILINRSYYFYEE